MYLQKNGFSGRKVSHRSACLTVLPEIYSLKVCSTKGRFATNLPCLEGLNFRIRQIRWLIRCLESHFTGGKETDRKWEEGDEITVLEFAVTDYCRRGKVIASEDVKSAIRNIGINKCAHESGFDRKNFVRKLVRDIPVNRNS